MTKTILLSSFTFLAGLICGFAIWHTAPEKELFRATESCEVDETQDTAATEHLLEITQLKEEIQQLKAAAEESLSTTPEAVEQQAKMSLVQAIVNGDNDSPKQAEMDRKNLLRKINSLNLTPEQMAIAEQLWQKHMRQMRLLVQTRGLLTDAEQNELYPGLRDFNFDEELQKILTDTQSNSYGEVRQLERAGIGKIMSGKFFNDYRISDSSGFSNEDRAAIETVIAKVYVQNEQIVIPATIQELNLDTQQKRVLASCYENLPHELFEKIYQQMVNEETLIP